MTDISSTAKDMFPMKRYGNSINGLNDKRLVNAAVILNEFTKEPMKSMPKLRENFLTGKVYGTVFEIEYNDGTIGYTIGFDLDKTSYTISEKEYSKYGYYLGKWLSYFHCFDKIKGEYES